MSTFLLFAYYSGDGCQAIERSFFGSFIYFTDAESEMRDILHSNYDFCEIMDVDMENFFRYTSINDEWVSTDKHPQ